MYFITATLSKIRNLLKSAVRDNEIVLANILPEVLVPLSENIEENVKMGGYIIYSGILEFKVQEVVDAINANGHFEVKEIREQGEWRAIVATRNK